MQSITIAPKERKDLILMMRRESKPSRRLRIHIVLLASEGYSATKIARVLYCSRTTLYTRSLIVSSGRGNELSRTAKSEVPHRWWKARDAEALVEDLTEGVVPTERGWLRSRWSCKLLALELFKERALVVSQETVRRVLHRLGFRWRRPRPVPPPKDPKEKRKRLEEILKMLRRECSFFQDETKLETNPRVGFAGCAKGTKSSLEPQGPTTKSVDLWSSAVLYGSLPVGEGRAEKRRAILEALSKS